MVNLPGPGRYEIIELSECLQGQDNNLHILSLLFEQLQLATVEAADPHLDLITFAESAYYFSVTTEHHIPEALGSRDSEAAFKHIMLLNKAAKERAKMERSLKI